MQWLELIDLDHSVLHLGTVERQYTYGNDKSCHNNTCNTQGHRPITWDSLAHKWDCTRNKTKMEHGGFPLHGRIGRNMS